MALKTIHRYAASVIMSITYGKTTPTYYSDPEVQEIVRCAIRLGGLLGGAKPHIVDMYPILRHIPFFTSVLYQWRADEHKLFVGQVEKVRKQVVRTILPWFRHAHGCLVCVGGGICAAVVCDLPARAAEGIQPL